MLLVFNSMEWTVVARATCDCTGTCDVAYDVEIHVPNKKNLQFGLWASYKPTPSLRKISYKYNSMLTYIPVSFLFSFKKGFGLRLKIGLGLG